MEGWRPKASGVWRKELSCVNSIFRENIEYRMKRKDRHFPMNENKQYLLRENLSLKNGYVLVHRLKVKEWEKLHCGNTDKNEKRGGGYKYQIKYTLSKKQKNKRVCSPTELNNLHINCYLNVTFSIFRSYKTVTKARSWTWRYN